MVFEVLNEINKMLNTSPDFIIRMTEFLMKSDHIEKGRVESVQYIKQERKHYNSEELKELIAGKNPGPKDYIEINIIGKDKRYAVTITEEYHITDDHGLILYIREKPLSKNSPKKKLYALLLIGLTENRKDSMMPVEMEAPEGPAVFTCITEKTAGLFLNLGYYIILPCFLNLFMSSLYPITKLSKGESKRINNTFESLFNFLESINTPETKDMLAGMMKRFIKMLEDTEQSIFEKHIEALKKYL